MTNAVLMDLAVGLVTGSIKVVDLSVTLSPETPILELPEEFGWGKSWPFSKKRSPATTIADPRGIGTISSVVSTPAPISTRRCIG